MKNILKLIVMAAIWLASCIIPDQSQAQSNPAVSIISATEMVLDTVAPLSSQYDGSIAALNFTNQTDAENYFASITDNLLSYLLDYANGQVTVQLGISYAPPGWDVADWNNYIHNKLNP